MELPILIMAMDGGDESMMMMMMKRRTARTASMYKSKKVSWQKYE